MLNTFFSLILFVSGIVPSNPPANFKLPENWERGFEITLTHSGAGDGSTTELTYKYDFARYVVRTPGQDPQAKVLAMTPELRKELLEGLHKLRPEKIKIDGAVEDGWKRSICFGDHCLTEGSAVKMSSDDKSKFADISTFLVKFVVTNTK